MIDANLRCPPTGDIYIGSQIRGGEQLPAAVSLDETSRSQGKPGRAEHPTFETLMPVLVKHRQGGVFLYNQMRRESSVRVDLGEGCAAASSPRAQNAQSRLRNRKRAGAIS